MRVCVAGLGYIGLPTAMILAAKGVEVTGVDYNETLVSTLNHGRTTFQETGLEELYQAALRRWITFTTAYPNAD